ncbi:MAG: hypothetical protein FD130_1571 [Halothiobacillaceae bacterium]|nr:MAG: hypothetical protein FD130_1571 [Halothiobacillaceae bacterium]
MVCKTLMFCPLCLALTTSAVAADPSSYLFSSPYSISMSNTTNHLFGDLLPPNNFLGAAVAKTKKLVETPHRLFDSAGKRPSLVDRLDIEESEYDQYAIFRSDGTLYFKGKAGYLADEERQQLANLKFSEIIDGFNNNGALGLGAGYKLNNGDRFEIDYIITRHAEQIFQVEYMF